MSLLGLLNEYAPVRTKKITVRPRQVWLTKNILLEKRKRRRIERLWRRTRLIVHEHAYRDQCKLTAKLIQHAKTSYFNNKIKECSGDQRKLFRLSKVLFGTHTTRCLPPGGSPSRLAEQFNSHFITKVNDIRRTLQSEAVRPCSPSDSDRAYLDFDIEFSGAILSELQTATTAEVSLLIQRSNSKSSISDPIPTSLVKKCLPELVPVITKLINRSLVEGYVPKDFKLATVTPVPKKRNTNLEMANFRPISQLPFVSKILEKVVARRITSHIHDHELFDPFQSAYRSEHSTESALLRIQHDIMEALDGGQCVALVMLDLSAAFDVIDHNILTHRLEFTYGISGTALQWFRSYLSERRQRVRIESQTSSKLELECGVPQGSVLGPLLYTMYSKPIGEICRRHNMLYHCYADDTQIYLSVKRPNTVRHAVRCIEACLADMKSWMKSNMLKLNDQKTEFAIFSTRQLRDIPNISIGSHSISPSSMVRNLEIIMDRRLTMVNQVHQVIKVCNFHIRL